MRSPFPGMDPYLEAHWRDVHHRLVTYSCDVLQGSLPRDLRARLEERVFVESETAPPRNFYPDVRVVERPTKTSQVTASPGGTALLEPAEPVIFQLPDERISEGYIQIIDASSGNRVISVIEFLSLANKTPGEGRRLYEQKKADCRAGNVNFVEVDLIRQGERLNAEVIPRSYRAIYGTCVWRASKFFQVEYYPAPLRQRLPVIAIPLRETDKDVLLDLQALIDQCYRNGAYDDIDYSQPAIPPLEPADDEWAKTLPRG